MNDDHTTYVRLIDGRAEVQIGERTLNVSRRDIPDETYNCPVELLTAALGS